MGRRGPYQNPHTLNVLGNTKMILWVSEKKYATRIFKLANPTDHLMHVHAKFKINYVRSFTPIP